MLNQFSRTQLLLGKGAMDRLQQAHVAVFGIGGWAAMSARLWFAAAWAHLISSTTTGSA